MSKDIKKVPKLRFSGFEGEWESEKIGNLGNTYTGLSGKTKEDFGKGSAKFVTYMNVFSNSFADLAMNEKIEIDEKQNTVKYGDVFFTVSSETPNEVGMSSVWLGNEENVYLNSFCFGFRLKKKVDLYYLGYLLRSPSVRSKLIFLAQGISRYNISKTKVLEISVLLPKLQEQKKVGVFFRQLDDLIKFQEHKLKHLKLQKQALLQKMFPQNGSNIPEIRFPEFSGEWKIKKLRDICTHHSGVGIEKFFDANGIYKVISIGSYGLDNKYIDQGIRAVSNETTDARLVNSGELTMVLNDKTANGTIIGKTLLINENNAYVANQRTEIIKPNEEFDSVFAYTSLNGYFRNEVKKLVQGGTQIYVNFSAVKKLTLFLPEIEEQQKVGEFFQQLDTLITLHERKLKHLELQKKALLQQLFV